MKLENNKRTYIYISDNIKFNKSSFTEREIWSLIVLSALTFIALVLANKLPETVNWTNVLGAKQKVVSELYYLLRIQITK